MTAVDIKVRDIKIGDQFRNANGSGWVAISGSSPFGPHLGNGVAVDVQHQPGGGLDTRTWDNGDHVITVER